MQYTEIMFWYSGGTNSNKACKISLHCCGHAHNNNIVHLRALSHFGNTANMYLQIKIDDLATDAIPITFHF